MTRSPDMLLQELYEIDPSLRAFESDLRPLIAQLLERDPAQKPSPAFVKKLRKELEKHGTSGATEYRMTSIAPAGGFFARFAYATIGAIAAVVIAVPTTLQYAKQQSLTEGYDTGLQRIQQSQTEEGTMSPEAKPMNIGTYRPQSGGGGGDTAMDGNMSAVSSLIAPWNPVKYQLEGELPELPQDDVTVLTRRSVHHAVPSSRILSSFENSSIDLSSFDGTTIESVAIAQRQPYGYFINISVPDSSVSINQMWDQWPHPENDCRDEACFRRLQLSPSDIPADADLIQIANAFLAEHAIDLGGYGTPIVDNTWRQTYESTADKRMAYVPDMIRVIYPLIVDGQTVMEAGGEPAGISVQVSVRHDRVSDVWGLTTYDFDRTDHKAVSDRADVETFLALAGAQIPDAPTITVSNPTRGYVRLHTYENNRNQELLVPALIFQVTNVPATIPYYQRTVAVPLAKDLLDQATPPIMIDPVPTPRPLDLPVMQDAAE